MIHGQIGYIFIPCYNIYKLSGGRTAETWNGGKQENTPPKRGSSLPYEYVGLIIIKMKCVQIQMDSYMDSYTGHIFTYRIRIQRYTCT